MKGYARTYHLRVTRSQKSKIQGSGRDGEGDGWRRLNARRVAPAPETITVAEAAAHYLRLLPTLTSRRGLPYSSESMRKMSENMTPFAREHPDTPLQALDAELVASHLAAMRARGLSQHTIATRDSVLRTWLAWLVEREWLPHSPLRRVRRQAAPDPPVSRLTDAEVCALLAACDRERWGGVRDHAVVLTLWRTGLRVTELCALEVADYDSVARRLMVRHGKGDKPRLLGVPDDAAAAIDDWLLSARGTAPGPLFPSAHGTRFNRRNLALALSRVATRAGVAGVHPHRLRHTYACNYLLAGGDIYQLSRLLGHSTLAMTGRYLRAIEAEEAAESNVRLFGRR
jgi:site-specific recombinase XerD